MADLLCSARRPPADLILPGDGALPPLPPRDVILALWGVSSNSADATRINSALAHRSRSVAQACGARLVLHLSSAAVYGPGTALRETDAAQPLSHYGRSKLRMEEIVSGFDDREVHHVCLRLANVVGADSLAPALAGPGAVTLDRFADGEGPRRSYIAPGDLARTIVALSTLPSADLPRLLNIAAPQPVSMAALAEAAGREITWRAAPPAALQEVSMNTARLRRLLPDMTFCRSATEMIKDWQTVRGQI